MQPTKIKICDLKLGDVVQLSEGAYMCATVQQVTADEVILFRPYVHCADFSYSGGVITYIGTETVKYYKDTERWVTVLERVTLK